VIERFELRHSRGATLHLYGSGAVAELAEAVAERLRAAPLFVISAEPILERHRSLIDPLAERAASLEILTVPDGEAAKSVAGAERIWRHLTRARAGRDALVAAFGGGSVGDLAGFVAGAFARGLGWLQLPTTLLAQVDAAVGGKTAVDLPESKNAVGLFHHPLAVAADPEPLSTLSTDQRRAGLVEIVKAAALLDLGLLADVEADLDRLLAGEADPTTTVAARAARVKAKLVELDPEEAGPRRLLNFGHTLGHALEAEIGYGAISHGDAVAHGLRFASRLAVVRGGDRDFTARLDRLIARLSLPPLPPLDARALLERIERDKKRRGGRIAWVLAMAPGTGVVDSDLPPGLVAGELASFLSGESPAPL
jgi:3-dehydroquinate synthase